MDNASVDDTVKGYDTQGKTFEIWQHQLTWLVKLWRHTIICRRYGSECTKLSCHIYCIAIKNPMSRVDTQFWFRQDSFLQNTDAHEIEGLQNSTNAYFVHQQEELQIFEKCQKVHVPQMIRQLQHSDQSLKDMIISLEWVDMRNTRKRWKYKAMTQHDIILLKHTKNTFKLIDIHVINDHVFSI